MALPTLPFQSADEVLKTNSVKQLPQSKQVPIIYDRNFESTEIVDTHLVIKALRADIATLYDHILALAALH